MQPENNKAQPQWDKLNLLLPISYIRHIHAMAREQQCSPSVLVQCALDEYQPPSIQPAE